MMNNDLFDNNINLVNKIVNKMNYGYVDKDDLMQAGLIGLYKATLKFNKKINSNFISFASIYIIGEIKEELRNNKLIKLNKNIIKIKKYLSEHENLSLTQIANNLNVSIDSVNLALIYKKDIVSLNEVIDEEELIDNIEDKYEKYNFLPEILKLDSLSKRILILKYYKNYSQSEISKLINCSQSKISRIETKALRIIKNKLL